MANLDPTGIRSPDRPARRSIIIIYVYFLVVVGGIMYESTGSRIDAVSIIF